MTLLYVVLGGAVGAPARYLLDLSVQSRIPGRFPTGTLLVNVSGSLMLGLIAGAASPGWVASGLGVGFCGAFTTFSTFGLEAVRLFEQRRSALALGYVVLSLVAGLAAASLGWWIAD